MLRRFLGRDRRSDGLFVTGVLTTGIYCLPSCTARKPKPQNVRFFPDPEAARRFGLRPCMRCRPTDFYRGVDPDQELVASLAGHVRRTPGDFADVSSLATNVGFGATKLAALFRRNYHQSPAQYLLAARVAWATRELLNSSRRAVDVGLDAGFESQSAFHENFQRRTGMTPGAFRRLPSADTFSLRLPDDFRPDEVCSILARSQAAHSERIAKAGLVKAALLGGVPRRVEIQLTARRAKVRVLGARRSSAGMVAAHRLLVRLLGLEQEPGAFERRAKRRGFGALVQGRKGLRVPLTADPFEAIVWVIVGQQVTVSFAAACRDRLIELCGRSAGDDMRAHPRAQDVAALDVDDLRQLKLTTRKSEYLIGIAREIAEGRLDLEALGNEPAGRIEETLLALRGLGVWSVQYLMMRAFGLADCTPLGDTGLTSSLQSFFELEERPDPKQTVELMRPFAPDRSLATFHLWKRLGDPA